MLQENDHKIEKLGYNYNELTAEQANRLLEALLKNGRKIKRLDIKGNEFSKKTRETYLRKLKESGTEEALSKFDSDSDGEPENELLSQFENMRIQ